MNWFVKFVSDLFQGVDGRTKPEKIWAHITLIIFHTIAYRKFQSLDLWVYAAAAAGLHAALFTSNGIKTFLEKKPTQPPASINIETKEANVTTGS